MSGLLGQPEQQMPAPQPAQQVGGGQQTLAALASQGEQQARADMEAAAQARKQRRMGLLGVA